MALSLPQNLDFSPGAGTPFDFVTQGYDEAQRRRLISNQLDKQEQEKQDEIGFQEAMIAISQNPNPTAEQYGQILSRYPTQAERAKGRFDKLSTDEKTSEVNKMTPVYNALAAGDVEAAKKILNEQLIAAENSGDMQQANAIKAMIAQIDMNPNSARSTIGFAIEQKSPGFLQKMEGLRATKSAEGQESAIQRQKEAEATMAEMGALGASQPGSGTGTTSGAEIEKEEKTTEDVRKELKETAQSSRDADMAADGAELLANQFDQYAQAGGLSTELISKWKKMMGEGNDIGAQLRTQYKALINENIIGSLPPGSSTDNDIRIFSQGMPDVNASSGQIVPFLRGYAKIMRMRSYMKASDVDWSSANKSGGYGNLRQGAYIRSPYSSEKVYVEAGTSHSDFRDSQKKIYEGNRNKLELQKLEESERKSQSPPNQPSTTLRAEPPKQQTFSSNLLSDMGIGNQ